MIPLTIGNTLKQEIADYAGRFPGSMELFVSAHRGEVTTQQARSYVRGLLFLIRGTMSILQRAERKAVAIGDAALAAHFSRKLREESGHDRWAEQDLRGLPRGSAEDWESDSTTALGRLLAYLDSVVDRDPSLFLSYILLAEYLTVLVGPAFLGALEDKCGIAQKTMTVVANHVELDRRHAEEGIAEIDSLVSAASKMQPMLDVLHDSIGYFEEFWNEIFLINTRPVGRDCHA